MSEPRIGARWIDKHFPSIIPGLPPDSQDLELGVDRRRWVRVENPYLPWDKGTYAFLVFASTITVLLAFLGVFTVLPDFEMPLLKAIWCLLMVYDLVEFSLEFIIGGGESFTTGFGIDRLHPFHYLAMNLIPFIGWVCFLIGGIHIGIAWWPVFFIGVLVAVFLAKIVYGANVYWRLRKGFRRYARKYAPTRHLVASPEKLKAVTFDPTSTPSSSMLDQIAGAEEFS